jgi:threonyl-tRNA synthetase
MFIYVNKEKKEIADSSSAQDLAKLLNLTNPEQAIAVLINGTEQDLTTTLSPDDAVEFIHFDTPKGKEIFWHTSAHVLAQAVLHLWPEAKATIGPAIDQGFYYDFANLTLSDQDFEKIEKEIQKILKENHHPQKEIFKNKQEAAKAFKENPYKIELIQSLDDAAQISAYRQGDFFDLCRGPHLPALSKIKAFKVLKTSGAHWKGDPKREMLTRIYAISFPDKKRLVDYLEFIEEAKKRDHKLIGQQLNLFSLKEEAPGMPFIHPKGLIIWENLLKFVKDRLAQDNYIEIKTPVLLNKDLWIRSGHWSHYRQNMYTSEIEGKEFALKPMNCPGCMLFFRSGSHSYRELPMRVAEIGLVHRHEASGALNGLFRVRSFHQDDAHIFMQPDDIKSEIIHVLTFADYIYSSFNLTYKLELSTRPEKSKTIGTDEEWEVATNGLKSALDAWGKPYHINEGDGAFYGPKIDFHIQDALGRSWQCGTVQLDMSLPEKFELEYVSQDGSRKRPIMIHRAICGSIERFFGILIEHFAGKFPLWLSPIGVRIISVAERHNEAAHKIAKQIRSHQISCDVDDSNESVGKKIRNAQLLKINYMLTVGDNEEQNGTVSLRTRDNVVHGELPLAQFLEKCIEEKNTRALKSPFSS